jgi:hypothetical protein
MAGHSKFKNIMHRKGAQDKKRSSLFSKLSREITVAAKMGLPDPDMNPRLRAAVNAAKAASLPKDNIQRSIDKASRGDAETYEEIRYEGFGPGGVSLIIEALTTLAAPRGIVARNDSAVRGLEVACCSCTKRTGSKRSEVVWMTARPGYSASRRRWHSKSTVCGARRSSSSKKAGDGVGEFTDHRRRGGGGKADGALGSRRCRPEGRRGR